MESLMPMKCFRHSLVVSADILMVFVKNCSEPSFLVHKMNGGTFNSPL